MRANTQISAWSQRTGNDLHGQPTRTAQTIRPLPALIEFKSKKLLLGGRELLSTCRVHVNGNCPIATGDEITVAGATYQVLDRAFIPGASATLTHTTLLLG